MNLNSLGDMIIDDRDPQEIFEILDLLGQGAYGSVSKALHKPTGELVAIKIVPNNNDQINNIKKEIIILRQCKSEYIVKYYGSYYKENNLWIVMEYCVAGSVIDVIRITHKELNEFQIASILQAVLRGLEYLHSKKVIHRDVKAGNILLDHKGNAKLADFGVSAEIVNTHAQRKTFIGSPYWMSPEILSESTYDNKTDIWSLGITAIELAEGNAPYSNIHPLRAMWVIRNNPVKSLKETNKWSEDFHQFIGTCLNSKPNERPTATDLLSHPFITKKAKGKAILSELVLNSMDAIEKFRIKQSKRRFSSEDQDGNSLQMKFVEDKKQTIKMDGGTIKRLDEDEEEEEEPYQSGTLVIKQPEPSQVGSANSPSESQKDKDQPQFLKFARKMREADDLYNNRDKFKQYIENKSELPSPIEFTSPRVFVQQKPPTQEELRDKITQLDEQCQQQMKKLLAKYKQKIDQQATNLSKIHNKTFNKGQLKTYNMNLQNLTVSSHLKRQPAEIRNINNINSINISINQKKTTTKEVKQQQAQAKNGCSSCQKELRIQEDKEAFKKSKKYKQFVDDSEVLEYLKKNYMCKK